MIEWLNAHGACREGIEYASRFRTLQEAWAACTDLEHLKWVACAPAEAEYLKARASAWAEYDKVCDGAWAGYDKAMAPAWVEYNKACDVAGAGYDKATAGIDACKTCDELRALVACPEVTCSR
jgi:hypothetical protein